MNPGCSEEGALFDYSLQTNFEPRSIAAKEFTLLKALSFKYTVKYSLELQAIGKHVQGRLQEMMTPAVNDYITSYFQEALERQKPPECDSFWRRTLRSEL